MESEKSGRRPLAEFPPDLWADHFASLSPDPSPHLSEYITEHGRLMEEIRDALIAGLDKPCHQLEFIDSVQRLGVSYHFHAHIELILLKIVHQNDHLPTYLAHNHTLHGVSLLFRLLRQSGLQLPCDVFEEFKDENGGFKNCLSEDVEGLLSLYEAANLRLHGEDILEQAFDFTTKHLKSIAMDHESRPKLAAQARQALKYPILKNIPRLETIYYISFYQQQPSHNKALLTFAKLDFNILQDLHRKELSQIAKWWKSLDIPKRLPFARDKIAELYIWAVGAYYEPCYALARKISTKIIALTSILDDTYDAYGTIEELELLTEAIQRWDRNAIKEMGLDKYECIKVVYEILLDTFEEFGEELRKLGKSCYGLNSAMKLMKKQARSYLSETRWRSRKHRPSLEEYLDVGIYSSTVPMLTVSSLVGMVDDATHEAFDWACSMPMPKLIVAASVLGRVIDDIATHEFEQQRDHADSAVECYMNQHGGTRAQAVEGLNKLIVANYWKDINQAFMRPRPIPAPEPVLLRPLNLARTCHVVYADGDGYTFSHLYFNHHFAALLLHQLEIPLI